MITRSRLCTVGVFTLSSLLSAAVFARPSADVKPADPQETTAIRSLVANAVGRSVENEGLERVLDDVGSHARARIEQNLDKSKEQNYAKEAAEVRKMWALRYEHEFASESNVKFADTFDVSLDKDGKHAFVSIPKTQAESAFTLHLIHEKDSEWRIEPSGKIDGKAYEENMLKGLTWLDTKSKDLPKDEEHAYEVVASEMLRSLTIGR